MSTTAQLKVRSGHLTTNGRAVIEVIDTAGDMVILSMRMTELSIELAVAGDHRDELVRMLTDMNPVASVDQLRELDRIRLERWSA